MSKTDIRKNSTGKFLREFELTERLNAIPEEEISTPCRNAGTAVRLGDVAHPFDPLIETGDIRLFSQTERITYGVVMPWDDLRALVVPMSHYDNPADDSEFYAENAENAALFMCVYQLWNARTIQKSLLSRTWKVGKVSPSEIRRLKQMLRHEMLGEKLSDSLSDLRGLSDERLSRLIGRYRNSELENFTALDEEDMQLESAFDELPEFDFQPLRDEFETLMAAAGRETLSPVYIRKGKNWRYLDAVEAENFRRVKSGCALPLFSWSSEALDVDLGWRVVAFRDARSHALLGAGVIEPTKNGAMIRLRYPVDKQDVPELSSPADIEIIILER